MSTEKVMTMVPEDLAPTSDIEYPTDLGKASLPAGAALMREFLAHSPFVSHLGMRLEAIHPDVVRVSRQLCFCDVDVADGHGRLVARGLVTYKLGGTR
jgi:acyl-coenzyme A thioesterase PaaI-like protein